MIFIRSILVLLISVCTPLWALTYDAEVGAEYNYFTEASLKGQPHYNGAAYVSGEVYHEWNGGDDSITFQPFYSWDDKDKERRHGDIRELYWMHVEDVWDVRMGISKVFWGVTESQHLVDVINQTDFVEGFDGEEKLGQPMINLSLVQDYGIFDLYILPTFRERTFPGKDSRVNSPFVVDTEEEQYESGADNMRTDIALRWQHYIGGFEFALSHFSGTNRDPQLNSNIPQNPMRICEVLVCAPGPTNQVRADFDPVLTPYYSIIDQTGVELQYIYDGLILKSEVMTRSGDGDRFTAGAAGFEYTQVGLWDSAIELGWVVEYMADDRAEKSPAFSEHDWLLATRWTLNDAASSEMLLGVFYDPETEEKMFSVESSRRIGADWKASLEARFFSNTGDALTEDEYVLALINGKEPNPDAKLSNFENQDFLQLSLVRYF